MFARRFANVSGRVRLAGAAVFTVGVAGTGMYALPNNAWDKFAMPQKFLSKTIASMLPKENIAYCEEPKAAQNVAQPKKLPPQGIPGSIYERSFIAVKPDGVQRGKVGDIIARFEAKGYRLAALKLVWPSKDQASQHYADLAGKPFFGGLVDFMSSGPIVCMVWEGKDMIRTGRRMLGETDPNKSAPGTIRGDFCVELGRNIIHGSDGPESAEHEINFWFKPEEVHDWIPTNGKWVYEL